MKVQPINTKKGTRYILIGDDYKPIDNANRYLRFLDNTGKSPNTIRSYAYNLLLFYIFMKNKGVPVLNLCNNPEKGPIEILSKFVLWLQYPDYTQNVLHINGEDCIRSNKTVNYIMATVLEFYKYLSANGQIQQLEAYKYQMINGQFKPFLYELVRHKRKVMSSIFKKPVTSVPVQAVTRDQYNAIFGACLHRRDQLLVAFLYEGGMRLNEALGMHLSDISHIEDNTIDIVARENNENGARVKEYAEGKVYLPDYVVDLLLDYINEDIVEYESNFLFLNLYGKHRGTPMRDSNAEKLFLRLSKKIGFRVHPHMLRHGFAQEKLEAWHDITKVQAYLRHRNPTSTAIYAQWTDAMKQEALREFHANHDYAKEESLLVHHH